MYATWWNPLTWYLPTDPKDNPNSTGSSTVGGGVNNSNAQSWPWWLDLMVITGVTVVGIVAVKAIIEKKL